MYLRVNEGSRSRHRCSAALSNFIISWNVSETEMKFIDNNGRERRRPERKDEAEGKGPGGGGGEGEWKVEGRTSAAASADLFKP